VSLTQKLRSLFGTGRDEQSQALDEQQTDDARIGQLKREFAEHPSKGLTPSKLHTILEAAEQGDLKAQSELFDDMEEKDAQIGADLGKRRQLSAELEWQIVAPDNASAAEKRATDFCAEVFDGLEIEDLILDLGTGIGHGWANLELNWSREGAQRFIEQPQLRPHTWFRLHQEDQNRITLRDHSANGADLWALGWVQHRHRAKPGYVARMGLGRMLVWPYLFQNYALGDLAQLLEIYGMPARVGKYPKNATAKEKATLLRAVVSLGKDAAGIIPEGMAIEFMEAAQGRADMFLAMMNWCEAAKAKAILGGTLTSGTGEGTNTNALGNVHERGQASLIRSDIRQYGGTIQRDILWPLAALNFNIDNRRRAPKFVLDMGETEDYQTLATTLPTLVNMGAKIPLWWLHEKTGIPEATEQDEILTPRVQPQPFAQSPGQAMLKTGRPPGLAALREAPAPVTPAQPEHYREPASNVLGRETQPVIDGWIDQIQRLVGEADSFEQLQSSLLDSFSDLDEAQLAEVMGQAFLAANLAGRSTASDEADDANG
jgi:phage gp29-like protein